MTTEELKLKKQILDVIDEEIKWFRDNKATGDQYETGFIAGLLQARALIKLIPKTS